MAGADAADRGSAVRRAARAADRALRRQAHRHPGQAPAQQTGPRSGGSGVRRGRRRGHRHRPDGRVPLRRCAGDDRRRCPAPCATPAGGRCGRRSRNGSALLEAAKPKSIKLAPNGELRWRGAVVGAPGQGQSPAQAAGPAGRRRRSGPRRPQPDRSQARELARSPSAVPAGARLPARRPRASAAKRGALLYQLGEAGGHLPRRDLRSAIDGVDQDGPQSAGRTRGEAGRPAGLLPRAAAAPGAGHARPAVGDPPRCRGNSNRRRLQPASKRPPACRRACCRPAAMSSRKAVRCAPTGSRRCGARSRGCRRASR